jgi:hypothetical protein
MSPSSSGRARTYRSHPFSEAATPSGDQWRTLRKQMEMNLSDSQKRVRLRARCNSAPAAVYFQQMFFRQQVSALYCNQQTVDTAADEARSVGRTDGRTDGRP